MSHTSSPGASAFQEIVQRSAVGLMVIQDAAVVYCNPEAARLFAYSEAELCSLSLLDLIAGEDVPFMEVGSALRAQEPMTHSVQGVRKDGKTVPLEWTSVPSQHDGRCAIVATVLDATDRREAERRAQEEAERYQLLTQHMTDMICLHAPEGEYKWVSPSVEFILGYSPEEFLTLHSEDLLHPEEAGGLLDLGRTLLLGGERPVSTLVHRCLHKGGHYVWLESHTHIICDDTGEILHLQTSARDVTERRKMELRLERQAHYDPLTGLPNRRLFLTRLTEALAHFGPEHAEGMVLVVDLDRFEAVNDTLGYSAGDEVLQEVARRLTRTVGPTDTVARIGSDEFAVLLPTRPLAEGAEDVALRIRSELNRPIQLRYREETVAASVGAVTGRADHVSASRILSEAMGTVHVAKTVRKGIHIVRSQKETDGTSRGHRLEMDLRHAVARGELRAFYQPVVRLSDLSLAGFEALVRWEHPEFGLLGPEAFLRSAERSGQITAIDRWILREAGRQAYEWGAASDGRPLAINVNCTGHDVLDAGYTDDIRWVLDLLHDSPYSLALEITESLLVEETGLVSAELQEHQAAGARVCIDDFGTGYSSLRTLQELPIDVLKVDRSFVNTMTKDTQSRELVRAVVHLSQVLGKHVVAEGIESAEQAELLRQMGATYGQGYLFGKPMPAGEAAAFTERGVFVAAALA
ncbi:putative bifunctional diguanylate cyclase/phosphodiesterase [Rubricoccus marinus]|uniref:GGDEF domain-containing protein n=1 Tax=Rubricoccus marinus TaxID=716817 RepID=A0A259U3J8_9BACT|nr:EAL domain-containing protein [Rubricoccus marinus]OZC04398.1 hypothetical protein BSZ36_16270 [Rubricoccus marinus]